MFPLLPLCMTELIIHKFICVNRWKYSPLSIPVLLLNYSGAGPRYNLEETLKTTKPFLLAHISDIISIYLVLTFSWQLGKNKKANQNLMESQVNCNCI